MALRGYFRFQSLFTLSMSRPSCKAVIIQTAILAIPTATTSAMMTALVYLSAIEFIIGAQRLLMHVIIDVTTKKNQLILKTL